MSIIRLTDKCNEKCLFCNFQEKLPSLSFGQIKKQIRDLRQREYVIILSGGEPTLHPDLIKIVSFAKELGFKIIEIQTNAILLTKDKVLKLKRAGLNRAFVPLLAYKAELFDELTQVPESWQKTLKGIKNLLAAGIETRINIVINSKNYIGLLNLTKFIHKNFPNCSGIDYSFVVSDGLALENSYLVPKMSKVIPYLLMAYKYCENNNIDFSNPGCGVPVCFLPDKYKDISLEYKLLRKNEKNNDIIERNQPNKIKLKKCQTCPDEKYCLGVWQGYIQIHGDKEFI